MTDSDQERILHHVIDTYSATKLVGYILERTEKLDLDAVMQTIRDGAEKLASNEQWVRQFVADQFRLEVNNAIRDALDKECFKTAVRDEVQKQVNEAMVDELVKRTIDEDVESEIAWRRDFAIKVIGNYL